MFPYDVDQPNVKSVAVLTAELSIARLETDYLMKDSHPFLVFSGVRFCDICSCSSATEICKECEMQFCLHCDERWHSHKLRRNHMRTSLLAVKDQAVGERK